MLRCISCQSYRDVRLVDRLPWCFACVTDGYAADYAARVDFFLDASVDAELARRHIPGPRRLSLVKGVSVGT